MGDTDAELVDAVDGSSELATCGVEVRAYIDSDQLVVDTHPARRCLEGHLAGTLAGGAWRSCQRTSLTIVVC